MRKILTILLGAAMFIPTAGHAERTYEPGWEVKNVERAELALRVVCENSAREAFIETSCTARDAAVLALYKLSYCPGERDRRGVEFNLDVCRENSKPHIFKSSEGERESARMIELFGAGKGEIEVLLDAENLLNEACRGSSDEASIDASCPAREATAKALRKLGWCYGEKGQRAPQMVWHKCTRTSLRQ